jgi:hypothetical protein
MKAKKDIKNEIQAIIRQITASVTFLPMLDEPCSFDLLVYTDNDTKVPKQWEESDPQFIADSTDVRLRSFTTKVIWPSSLLDLIYHHTCERIYIYSSNKSQNLHLFLRYIDYYSILKSVFSLPSFLARRSLQKTLFLFSSSFLVV